MWPGRRRAAQLMEGSNNVSFGCQNTAALDTAGHEPSAADGDAGAHARPAVSTWAIRLKTKHKAAKLLRALKVAKASHCVQQAADKQARRLLRGKGERV